MEAQSISKRLETYFVSLTSNELPQDNSDTQLGTEYALPTHRRPGGGFEDPNEGISDQLNVIHFPTKFLVLPLLLKVILTTR